MHASLRSPFASYEFGDRVRSFTRIRRIPGIYIDDEHHDSISQVAVRHPDAQRVGVVAVDLLALLEVLDVIQHTPHSLPSVIDGNPVGNISSVGLLSPLTVS